MPQANGSLTYTSVTDTAEILANNAGNYVNGSVDVNVTNGATISQISLISGSTTGDIDFDISSSEATKGIISASDVSQSLAETIQEANNFNNFAYQFTGNSTGDTFTGGKKKDKFVGYGGDDTLIGNKGGDTLKGSSGSDTLIGGGGGDKLTGGSHADILTGNQGKDKFIFGKNDSLFGQYDAITDLEIGTDRIKSKNTRKYVTNISSSPRHSPNHGLTKCSKTSNSSQIRLIHLQFKQLETLSSISIMATRP